MHGLDAVEPIHDGEILYPHRRVVSPTHAYHRGAELGGPRDGPPAQAGGPAPGGMARRQDHADSAGTDPGLRRGTTDSRRPTSRQLRVVVRMGRLSLSATRRRRRGADPLEANGSGRGRWFGRARPDEAADREGRARQQRSEGGPIGSATFLDLSAIHVIHVRYITKSRTSPFCASPLLCVSPFVRLPFCASGA